MNDTLKLFVSCGLKLEPLLVEELIKLGFPDSRVGYKGVHVTVPDIKGIYKINYCSRIASRVLLPLVSFKCFGKESLYRNALKIDWQSYIKPGKTFAVDANVSHRELRNSLFAAQIVKDAVCDHLREKTGSRPKIDVKKPDIQLNLFIHDETAVLSIDTSGVPLHKRGYRHESVEAPLQESIAAALLTIAGYTGEEVLLDPCCGSGTILIEAALIATKTPPGYIRRNWGFMSLPDYQSQEWLQIKNEADKHKIPLKEKMIFGLDVNKNAIWATKINLRAAGFQNLIEVTQADFRNYTPSILPNLIITNPPHGKRLGELDLLRFLYRDLGEFIKEKSSKPARGFVFTGSLELAKEIGLAAKRRHEIDNSGIDSRFLEFDVYS